MVSRRTQVCLCGCFDVRTGTFIISVLLCFISLSYFFTSVIMLSKLDFKIDQLKAHEARINGNSFLKDKEKRDKMKVVAMDIAGEVINDLATLLLSLLVTVAAVCLTIGLLLVRPNVILVSLIIWGVVMALVLLWKIYWYMFKYFTLTGQKMESIVGLTWVAICVILSYYLIYVVYLERKNIMQEKERENNKA